MTKNKTKKYAWAGLMLIVLIGAILYIRSARSEPDLAIDTLMHDFGDVRIAQGKVSTDFLLTNSGNGNLVITGLETSCMCTSAQIITDENKGPVYGMSAHGNPAAGSTTIAPAGTATLRVFYDPSIHKDSLGLMTRVVSVHSNAGTKQVRIRLNQVA